MSSVDNSLLQDAAFFANSALAAEREKRFTVASSYYIQAADNLMELIARSREANEAAQNIDQLKQKAESYLNRAIELKNLELSNAGSTVNQKGAVEIEYDRAKFLVSSAIEADAAGNQEDAVSAYTDAVELLLAIRKRAEAEQARPESAQQREMLGKLVTEARALAAQALQRAEALKQPKTCDLSTAASKQAPNVNNFKFRPLGDALRDDGDQPSSSAKSASAKPQVMKSGAKFTEEEKTVLRETSTINGRVYLPFIDEADSRERFVFSLPFSDRDGQLALSTKQLSRFDRWARPSEFMSDPKMIELISYHSIKQTVITDCSFVASLAVCAQYERRFHKRLLTNSIFPQRPSDGAPIYNPCGKYIVRLQLNGTKRKVVIDDLLPIGRRGELLCSYSVNANELWVSLLEKAYMKVMGGYDFPGSNGNIDLHALTGWIPERFALSDLSKQEAGGKPGENETERVFRMLRTKFHAGHCLVTAATGMMSEADADRAGLVPTHAYAVLDFRVARVGDTEMRFIQLKNPWSTVSWKGRFSATDTTSWTPALRRALDYEPEKARLHDDGIFWIDLEAFRRFFDVLYVNWSPALFSYKSTVHSRWPAARGPKRDLFNISDNPQYVVAFGPLSTAATCWVLLTRHITEKEDFADNRHYIALIVYRGESDSGGARRVYYPYDPKPIIDGVRINSPHYLVKLPLSASSVPQSFTLVISQYEKTETILYTLRAYGTAPFELAKIADPYAHKTSDVGEWSVAKRTAGGCANHRDSYPLNPTYQVQIGNSEADNRLLIELRAPRAYNVGFDVVQVASNRGSDTLMRKTSGSFRQGYCYLELDRLDGGVYNIVPCTYLPGQEGNFILSVEATRPIKLVRI